MHKHLSIAEVDDGFLKYLRVSNNKLYEVLLVARVRKIPLNSQNLIHLAIEVEGFVLELFSANGCGDLEQDFRALVSECDDDIIKKILWVKKFIIQKEAIKKYPIPDASFNVTFINDEDFCEKILSVPKDSKEYDSLLRYAAFACISQDGIEMHKQNGSVLFDVPRKTATDNLVDLHPSKLLHNKDFNLWDSGIGTCKAMSEAKYCLHCHKQNPQDDARQGQINNLQKTSLNVVDPFYNPEIAKDLDLNLQASTGLHTDLKEERSSEFALKARARMSYGRGLVAKDSCRAGLQNGDKFIEGCPLGQKISEMNLLKAELGVISPLVVAMLDNPLLLLTGRRICNDCERACIYQQTKISDGVAKTITPVDVPSLETKILEDVLRLSYGFEVYDLLTHWNPLDTVNCCIDEQKSDKKVLVVGLGPAGIAASYYLTKQGYNVTAIDGMKINPLPENIREIYLDGFVKDINPILNADLGGVVDKKTLQLSDAVNDVTYLHDLQNVNDAFGGVMRSGITSRWNKNFLTLTRILLERRSNFKIQSGIRFGGVYNSAFFLERLGFSYICLCIGAGRPAIPNNAKSWLNVNGVLTASNFLMTFYLGLERTFAKTNIVSPVVIYGSGLTAMDAAQTAKTFLGKDSNVTIVSRSTLRESKAYNQNHKELQECIVNGIEFIESSTISDIAIVDGRLSALTLSTGEVLNAKTLIIATGTSQNNSPLEENDININPVNKPDFSSKIGFFGDLNHTYSGSVVKAIASVKDNFHQVHRVIESKPNKAVEDIDLSVYVKEIHKSFVGNIISLTLYSPSFVVIDIAIGDIAKFQMFGNDDTKPIPVTLGKVCKNNSTVKIYLTIDGPATKELLRLKINDRVILMPSGERFNFEKYSKIAIISDKKISLAMSDLRNALITQGKTCHIFNDMKSYQKSGNVYEVIYNPNYEKVQMQCMLKGVCSRCITCDKNGNIVYRCESGMNV